MSQERTHNLSDEQIANLRNQNILNPGEFAYLAGDLVIAENAVTGERRIIANSSLLSEDSGNRRILKG